MSNNMSEVAWKTSQRCKNCVKRCNILFKERKHRIPKWSSNQIMDLVNKNKPIFSLFLKYLTLLINGIYQTQMQTK